jgi:hypothetical protein
MSFLIFMARPGCSTISWSSSACGSASTDDSHRRWSTSRTCSRILKYLSRHYCGGGALVRYAASLNFAGAYSVKVVADRVQVSQKWMIPFGVLLAAGAGGLLLGLLVPALGIAAGIGLVVYFICALTAHVRVNDRGIGGAVTFLVLALAILTVDVVYRTHS